MISFPIIFWFELLSFLYQLLIELVFDVHCLYHRKILSFFSVLCEIFIFKGNQLRIKVVLIRKIFFLAFPSL